MEEVSLEMVYSEIKELRKELEQVRYALIPEEEVNEAELKEIMEIEKKMDRGEKVKLENALKELNNV